MSSDAQYESFLNKANEPLSATQKESVSTSSSKGKFDPTISSSLDAAPPSIAKLLSSSSGPPTLTSETDAEFEPFFAAYSGEKLPSAAEFGKVAGGKGEVSEVKLADWNSRGKYDEVVKAVEGAGDGGNVKVYRLEVSSTRAVYFVVTLGEKGAKIVGVKAESVES
jgi:hypothetical protein